MDLNQQLENLDELIGFLLYCEDKDQKCAKCKKKEKCLRFIRATLAVALALNKRTLLKELIELQKEKKDKAGNIYT